MVRYLVNAQGAKKIAPEGDFCSEPVWSLEKPVFLCKREQVKPPIYPLSLWDKHCSRSKRGLG